MTDLADRAIARLTEIDESIRLLEYERDEISIALRVLSSFLEPRPDATDGQAAEYAVVTPAAAERVTAEDGRTSSAPIPPDVHFLALDREQGNEHGAAEAGGFDSHSLTEIEVKPQVRVLPGVDDAKGGPTGMGRSDGGESPAAGEATVSPAPVSLEGASEEVGGFPVAAAPLNSGATGGDEGDQTSQPESVVGTSDAAEPLEQSDLAAPEEPPVRSKRQQVRITHEDHPDWSAAQIAEHLGLTKGSVSGHASSLGIKFSAGAAVNPAASSITKLDRVRLMHEQHPTWTARMIALQLGEKESSVSTLLATVRKEVRDQTEPKPEFSSEQEMLQHYGDVAARLGKAK